jgi:hypothetical protein
MANTKAINDIFGDSDSDSDDSCNDQHQDQVVNDHDIGFIEFKEDEIWDDNEETFVLRKVPGIYIHKYGTIKWEKLSMLSYKKYTEHNWDISDYMTNLNNENNEIKNKLDKIEDDIQILTKIMLEKNNQQLIRDIYEQSNLNYLLEKICVGCCQEISNSKQKCFYKDTCPGLCQNCVLISEKGICNACHKSQTIQCPTCYIEKTSEQMCKSNHCSHSVCWECRGKSFRAGNPIEICPMCRSKLD